MIKVSIEDKAHFVKLYDKTADLQQKIVELLITEKASVEEGNFALMSLVGLSLGDQGASLVGFPSAVMTICWLYAADEGQTSISDILLKRNTLIASMDLNKWVHAAGNVAGVLLENSNGRDQRT